MIQIKRQNRYHESSCIHQEAQCGLQDCEKKGQALRYQQKESPLQTAPGLIIGRYFKS
jgi:hypothetical protein